MTHSLSPEGTALASSRLAEGCRTELLSHLPTRRFLIYKTSAVLTVWKPRWRYGSPRDRRRSQVLPCEYEPPRVQLSSLTVRPLTFSPVSASGAHGKHCSVTGFSCIRETVYMSDTRSNPPSPGAQPPDAEEEEVVPSSPAPVEEPPAEAPAPTKSKGIKDRKFMLNHNKKWFVVPKEHVVFDMGLPVSVADGAKAHTIHDSKSYALWKENKVSPKHIIKLKASINGKTQVGFYVTFHIGEEVTSDVLVIRNINKAVAKRFFDDLKERYNSNEEKYSAYKPLLEDEPSDESQIDPKFFHYDEISAPANILYCRAKKQKPAKAPATEPPAKKKKGASGTAERAQESGDLDDDQVSAAPSTALMPMQQPEPITGHSMGGSHVTHITYTQHPDCCTVPAAMMQWFMEQAMQRGASAPH